MTKAEALLRYQRSGRDLALNGRVRQRGLDSGGAASGQGQRRSGRDLAYCTDFSAGSLKKAALRGEGVV